MMAKDAPTDKKIKPKMEKKFEAEMNVKHTFKKSSGYYKEVEI